MRRGLVHRDVKPSNTLIARERAREHVYLVRLRPDQDGRARPDSVTASGQVVGHRGVYMAPEVIRGEQADGVVPTCDALGCVLFECLTGYVPFPGPDQAAVIYGHLERPPPRVRDGAAHLPAALDAVLARGLAKEPAERFESGAALGGRRDRRAGRGARPQLAGGGRPDPPGAPS